MPCLKKGLKLQIMNTYLLHSFQDNFVVCSECGQLLLIQLAFVWDHHHQVEPNVMVRLSEKEKKASNKEQ
jgi:hypothetical protein